MLKLFALSLHILSHRRPTKLLQIISISATLATFKDVLSYLLILCDISNGLYRAACLFDDGSECAPVGSSGNDPFPNTKWPDCGAHQYTSFSQFVRQIFVSAEDEGADRMLAEAFALNQLCTEHIEATASAAQRPVIGPLKEASAATPLTRHPRPSQVFLMVTWD